MSFCDDDGGDFYDYGDYGDCGDDSGDSNGDPGGDGSGDGGDVATKPYCPPFCPSQSWYAQQHGSVQMSGNTLPDGSTETSVEIDHSGGVTHGFIYHGSNGSQWYTGYNDGTRPETLAQFQANMDALYRQYQITNNCI